MLDLTKCKCYVKITDPERKKRFEGIFANDEIPISYPLPAGRGRTGKEVYEFYELDKTRVTEAQKQKIAERIAPAFDLQVSEILSDFNNPNFKVPIKADTCIVSWCSLHTRCLF